jgi:hypothetical protein
MAGMPKQLTGLATGIGPVRPEQHAEQFGVTSHVKVRRFVNDDHLADITLPDR